MQKLNTAFYNNSRTAGVWIWLFAGCCLALPCTVPGDENGAEYGEHWAFQPVSPPGLPEVKDAGWANDEIDRFILARLEAESLAPAPKADRQTLIRRISFALTGLPPTEEALKTHLGSQDDPDLSNYVDELLASPEFGEHWARHWLDHIRYRPMPKKGISDDPYRLWVMAAFNDDLPYDEFVRMQIAGDLMPGPNPDKEVFLDGLVAVRPFSLKSRDHQQIDLLGRTFMGLSLFCAQCHDHKHEPLSQDDYYAIKGIFDSSQVISAPYLKDKSEFEDYMAGFERRQANEQRMKKELKDYARISQLMDLQDRIEDERKKLDDPKQAANKEKIEKNIAKLEADAKKRLQEIEKKGISMDAPEAKEYIRINGENKEFDEKWKDVYQFDAFVDQTDPEKITDSAPPMAGARADDGDEVPLGDPVPRRFPVVLAGENQKPLGEQTKQSGRLELARWLSAPEHPITARLMVNRMWFYLIGEGLVPSLSNFGHSGTPPSHPGLLDHLSADFVKSGWSMKHIIRRMVLSSTFQQASMLEGAGQDELDQRVSLFGMARGKRLEAESIWRTLNRMEYEGEPADRRRAPPIDFVNEAQELFDGANGNLILPRRTSSITSLQALFFMNSEHVRASTEKIANNLHQLADDKERISYLYIRLFSREPAEEETTAGLEFIAGWEPGPAAEKLKPEKDGPPVEVLAKWQTYVQALLASNEFLFID